MADDEAKKIEPWAERGDRTDPEDVGIDRDLGWDSRYEQIGSGFEPERDVFNQLMHEISVGLIYLLQTGVPTWDADLDYPAGAFVASARGLHVALEPTGPATSNATDPTAEGQTVWRGN